MFVRQFFRHQALTQHLTRELSGLFDEECPVTDRPVNLRLDEQLCFALYAALGSVTRSYRPLLAKIGLTYPQPW